MFDPDDEYHEVFERVQDQILVVIESNSLSNALEVIKGLLLSYRRVVLEVLIANRYISVLRQLALDHDPPLITPDEVVKYDLFSFLIDSDCAFSPVVFRFLLDLNPSAVGTTFGEEKYLPIHIFSKFVANNIRDDDEFFTDLERLLELGIKYGVGDVDGVCGFGGLFVKRSGSRTLEAPISTLFHHFKYGYRFSRPHHILDCPRFLASLDSLNVKSSLLESAVMSEVGLCFVDDIVERGHSIGATRNHEGRLPLHYSVCSKVLEEFALNRVIESNPSALEEIDPLTELLPFCLAATIAYDCRSQGADRGLGIIYTLFRRRPILPEIDTITEKTYRQVQQVKRKRKFDVMLL